MRVAETSALPNNKGIDNPDDIQRRMLHDVSNAIGRWGRRIAIANDLPHFAYLPKSARERASIPTERLSLRGLRMIITTGCR
jgi:hypothetical protein